VKPACNGKARGRTFFRFMEVPFNTGVLEVWVIGTSHPRGCKSLPLKTGFRYAQIPFKTVFTVVQSVSGTAVGTGVIRVHLF
jgi:hypothetical protein